MEKTYQVISEEKEYEVVFNSREGTTGKINGADFEIDPVDNNGGFHVIQNGKGYNVEVLSFDREKKEILLNINHRRYLYRVKDRFDQLLEKLGMDNMSGSGVSEIKAPMPGLVLDVMVKPGDSIKADQPVLILEAMKMENVIKAPLDTSVDKVEIKKGDSVEKNQILVTFS